MKKASLLVVAALGLVLAPQASAHAEITPARVPANGESEFVLSVEGEEDAPTVKVAMQLPAGMPNVKPLPVPGWHAQMAGRVITWTGGRVPQGESGEFTIRAQFPNTPGARLRFPTVQTYGNGTIVRWIGAPSSDTPAPTILLTAAAQPPPPPPAPTSASAGHHDDHCERERRGRRVDGLAGRCRDHRRPGRGRRRAPLEAPSLRRALAVAALFACILAPGAEAHFGTGKLGYRSTIRCREAARATASS